MSGLMKRDGLNLEQDRMFLLVPSDITHTWSSISKTTFDPNIYLNNILVYFFIL